MRRFFKKLSELLSRKLIAVCLSALCLVTMIPMVYCFFFDYANGDDLYEGAAAHRVLVNGGTTRELFSAVWQWAKQDYLGWEGNWSSIILWCFEPSIWGEKVYLITPWIGVLFLLGGSGLFLFHFGGRFFKRNIPLFISACAAFFLCLIQNMPSVKNAFFWYTGMVNYIVPFGCFLCALVLADHYLTKGSKRYLVLICLLYAYMGGAGYPPIVLSFEVLLLIAGYAYFSGKSFGAGRPIPDTAIKKRALFLLLPLGLLTAGFIFSALSPGNAIRGGESYGFDLKNVASTLGGCILSGAKGIFSYFVHARFLYLLIPTVVLAAWQFEEAGAGDGNGDPSGIPEAVGDRIRPSFQHPLIATVLSFLISCSVYAPELYAKDDVSGGVPDIYFYTFLLTFTILLVYLTRFAKNAIGSKIADTFFAERIRVPMILLLMAGLLLFGRHFLAGTSGYMCYNFISSGGLRDFDTQMKERLALLNDPEVKDVVLPEMNDEQGPFMHMPVVRDPENYTSKLTAMFYEKNSVIAIPRDEWEALYGDD